MDKFLFFFVEAFTGRFQNPQKTSGLEKKMGVHNPHFNMDVHKKRMSTIHTPIWMSTKNGCPQSTIRSPSKSSSVSLTTSTSNMDVHKKRMSFVSGTAPTWVPALSNWPLGGWLRKIIVSALSCQNLLESVDFIKREFGLLSHAMSEVV